MGSRLWGSLMRPFTHTISLDEARALIDRTRRPRLPAASAWRSADANGRVCAADVRVDRRRAAVRARGMDGYAVVAADTVGASRHVAADAAAGRTRSTPARCRPRPSPRALRVEIATGAPMPDGADAVVMVEETDARPDDERARLRRRCTPRQNVGRQGADIARRPDRAARRRRAQPQPHRRAGGAGRRRGRGVRATDASRSSPPATRSSSRAARSRPDRSTTSTGSRWQHDRPRSTAACRCPSPRRTTRIDGARARARRVPRRATCSCSRAAAPSANAT